MLFKMNGAARAHLPSAIASLLLLSCCHAGAERLPQTIRPDHYALQLTPDLKAATFSGSETIDVNVQQPTKAITLNAADIQFQKVTVRAAGQEQTATIAMDAEKEQATFTFPQQLPAGKATLSIQYTGILNDKLRGFYLSKTARRNYAVTQFESTDARRAYPSFDEPAFKATYDVTLVIDKDDNAISNSPIKSDTPGPDATKHTVAFETTPKMSTYLVAFLVGDFQCTAGEQDGVKIRVCSTPDKVNLTSYGVDVAKYVLHYYNQYFGIPYPLKKLDLIGLPDFEAGAMENFGAITYRETALLIDPKTASVGAQKEVALVIAHEMAHQWFGDLVTMQWWDNVWLNEGFATWMENKPVEAMRPDWNVDQDVAAGLDNTLNLDAQPTTRAIRAKADTREEIEQMFDGISYGKAGAVLLMLENYLGPETFRKGVHSYLAAHLYGNATAEDFWGAQTATSHKPVDKIMESLVAQPGEPVLTFSEPKGGKVQVSQSRFFLSPSAHPDPLQKWTLPVCFKTSAGQQCQLLTPQTTSLNAPAGTLFYADAGGKGYYRTVYPKQQYDGLVAAVGSKLSPTERISLIGNEWVQVRSGKAKVGDFLDLAAAVKNDENSAVTGTAVGDIETILDRVAATKAERDAVAAWIRATFAPAYQKLGEPAPSDTPDKRQLRAQLFELLGGPGNDPEVISQARAIAQKYMADPTSVDANLGQAATRIAAEHGDSALFDQLQHIYETSTNPEIQIGALRELARFQEPTLQQRALEHAVSGKVRNQDALIQIAIAMSNPETRDQAWTFAKSHWDDVQKLLTPEIGNILVGSTGGFCSAQARDDVQQFFSTHKVPSASRALKHTIERIDGCMELRSMQEPNLNAWLQQHSAQTQAQ